MISKNSKNRPYNIILIAYGSGYRPIFYTGRAEDKLNITMIGSYGETLVIYLYH